MEILSGLGKIITGAGQDVVEQTGKLAEKARINSKISGVEKQLSAQLIILGKEYYKEFQKTGAHPSLDAVTILRQELQQLQEELSVVNGVRTCPQCDCQVGASFSFCQHCGITMTKEDVTIEETTILEEGDYLEKEYYEE